MFATTTKTMSDRLVLVSVLVVSAALGVYALWWANPPSHHGVQKVPVNDEQVDEEDSTAKEQQSLHGLFEDISQESGIDFTYRNGQEADHFAILESLGGGGALIDFDGDGKLDIFLCGGGYYDGPDKKQIKGHPCKLYKNLGNWKFVDVTKEVGLETLADGEPWYYTHGVAVADFDRDGWPDLIVTGWHELHLFHNEPVDPKDPSKGRKFVDVTKRAGFPQGLWTTSAAWADFDGDGYPDLYVCQYVDWSFANNPKCDFGGARDICSPRNFQALPHRVFHNNGDGTFNDVSNEAGLRMPRKEEDYELLSYLKDSEIENLKRADAAKEYGKGLGVIAADLNGDGKPDVYVANDTVDNFLYLNVSEKGKIRFREVGLASTTARDGKGSAQGSKGVDVADYDRRGRPSILVTNYENEQHALYHNDCRPGGNALFSWFTERSGIARIGQAYVGWGTAFIDIANRGWEDLFISNGHAIRFPTGKAARAQQPVIMRNMGNGKFKVMTKRGGSYAQTAHVGRGLLAGDLDNDGRIDLVLVHLNEPVSILRNIAGTQNHWLGIDLAGSDNSAVVGSKLTLEVGGEKQTRFAKGGGSYLSANDPRHVFGLGQATKIDKLTVNWPSGKEQAWTELKVDRYWRLTEGNDTAQEVNGSAKQ